MFKRIGELLVSYGELTTAELSMIHAEQERYYRPFGRIAAEMFGVSEAALWQAWAEQYGAYCPTIDLAQEPPLTHLGLLQELSPCEARQYNLLPIRYHDGDLILTTTIEYLAEALRFLDTRADEKNPALVWLTNSNVELRNAINQVYPISKTA